MTPTRSQARIGTPCICIVGGGFGGLYTALSLQKYRHLRHSQIILIEPRERFLFTPMMYELITDELLSWEIVPTYSSLLAGTNVTRLGQRAQSIDLEGQTVVTEGGHRVEYDYLVLATGAESRPVSVPGVDAHALTFRSYEDAQMLKARLAQLVQAQALRPLVGVREGARRERRADGRAEGGAGRGSVVAESADAIAVMVVGGGASGVELAAKVADYLTAEGHGNRRIILVDRGDQLLSGFPDGMRRQALRSLSERQVKILRNTSVAEVGAISVTLQQGEKRWTVPSQLTLWAVGTRPRPWLGRESVRQNDYGQVLTQRSLQLMDYDSVFALGDSADVRGPQGKAAPNTAQAAFQAASQVAKNIAAIARGSTPKPFNYLHLGDMITLGVGDAALSSFGLTLGGLLAALSRRVVYIFRMPTRRHQLKVARRALAELVRAIFRPLLSPGRQSRRSDL
ncbi:MAG: FAD-dependent oxidoreductase [Cyanobacteria bacterium J06554_11]